MYKIFKYKNLSKQKTLLVNFFFKKLINFKRSKWKKLRLILLRKKKNQKPFFLIHKKILVNVAFWDRVKSSFSNGIVLKRAVFNFFGNSLKMEPLKKKLKFRTDLLMVFWGRLFFRVDIMLWKLGLFKSVSEVSQYISKGSVILNDKVMRKVLVLRRGDILVLKEKPFYESCFISTNFFFSLCEIDLYTGTIVFLKSYNDLCHLDYSLVLKENINISLFRSYLRKK